jgi:hypothetical protein
MDKLEQSLIYQKNKFEGYASIKKGKENNTYRELLESIKNLHTKIKDQEFMRLGLIHI